MHPSVFVMSLNLTARQFLNARIPHRIWPMPSKLWYHSSITAFPSQSELHWTVHPSSLCFYDHFARLSALQVRNDGWTTVRTEFVPEGRQEALIVQSCSFQHYVNPMAAATSRYISSEDGVRVVGLNGHTYGRRVLIAWGNISTPLPRHTDLNLRQG